MTYLPDLHTYLHQSSLLMQAYPTARITTKYSLPRKATSTAKPISTETPSGPSQPQKEKREPSASLTLKTFHPESGICLKYRTDKAQEVGRLMSGLGKLAKGESIEMPSAAAAAERDRMEVDEPVEEKTAAAAVQGAQSTGGGGGKKKKKGGKK
jgi:hypothetical protein